MKKMILALAVILVLFASCEKQIDIPQLPYTSVPSIQCLITPGQIPKLYLNRTQPFLDAPVPNRDMFISNATATITSNGETDVLVSDSLYEIFYGTTSYFYRGSKPIQENVEYTLNIDFDGKSYSATATTDQPVVQIDSVGYTPSFHDIYGDHEGVIFYLQDDPNVNNYYRYEMHLTADTSTYWGENKFKSPILVNDETTPVYEIGRTIYSDNSFNGGSFHFVMEPVFKHKKDEVTYVFLQVCDKNMFDFYDELDKQMLAQKNPFVEPVFLTKGQFPDAWGIFGAYTVSDSVRFVYPE